MTIFDTDFDSPIKTAMEIKLELANKLIEDILEFREELPDEASELYIGATTTVQGIKEWMDESNHVTDKQITALKNILHGIQTWLDCEDR